MPEKKFKKKYNNNLNLEVGQIPPQAVDFEEGILGALLYDKDTIYETTNKANPPPTVLLYDITNKLK